MQRQKECWRLLAVALGWVGVSSRFRERPCLKGIRLGVLEDTGCLPLPLYLHIHVYTHTCTYTHTHIHIYTNTHTYTHRYRNDSQKVVLFKNMKPQKGT